MTELSQPSFSPGSDFTTGLRARRSFRMVRSGFTFQRDQDEERAVSISMRKWSLRYSFGVKP